MSNGAQIFIIMVFVTVVLLMQGLVVPVFGESAKMRKRLKKRIGGKECSAYIAAVQADELSTAAEIVTNFYDKKYAR